MHNGKFFGILYVRSQVLGLNIHKLTPVMCFLAQTNGQNLELAEIVMPTSEIALRCSCLLGLDLKGNNLSFLSVCLVSVSHVLAFNAVRLYRFIRKPDWGGGGDVVSFVTF